MSKFISSCTSICNVIGVLLLLILFACQCMPFWSFGEEETTSVSINGYIWFPTENAALESHLQSQLDDSDFEVDDILAMPIAVLVAAFAGLGVCIFKPEHPLTGILPAIGGLAGVWGYLAKPAFQLGANWQLHLVLSVLALAVAAAGLWFGYREWKAK